MNFYPVYKLNGLLHFFIVLLVVCFHQDFNWMAVLCSCLFLVVVAVCSFNEKFQKSTFSLFFVIFTFMFFSLPVLYLNLSGYAYHLGIGLVLDYVDKSKYFDTLPGFMVFLTICWFSCWLGIQRSDVAKINFKVNRKIFLPFLVVGFVVLLVTLIDNNNYNQVFIGGARNNNLITFLFFDTAFFLLAGNTLFVWMNSNLDQKNNWVICFCSLLLFFIVALIYFQAQSRSAILVALTLCYVYPFEFSKKMNISNRDLRYLSLNKYLLVFFLVLSVIIFELLVPIRTVRTDSIDLSYIDSFRMIIEAGDFWAITINTFHQVMERLCSGGLDRFFLIFNAFQEYDFKATMEFCKYFSKNTANLLLPGTVFSEAYLPTSQIFAQILLKDFHSSAAFLANNGVEQLIRNSNTQPFTIFGIFFIFFWFFSPFFLYFSVRLLSALYAKSEQMVLLICILSFFNNLLTCYGLDVVIGNTFHLMVSMFFISLLVKILSRLTQSD